MKTPEEWLKELGDRVDNDTDDAFMIKFIKDLQTDAFLSGQLDGLRQGKETALKVIDEVFSKPL